MSLSAFVPFKKPQPRMSYYCGNHRSALGRERQPGTAEVHFRFRCYRTPNPDAHQSYL
jgi:hypothetical protein